MGTVEGQAVGCVRHVQKGAGAGGECVLTGEDNTLWRVFERGCAEGGMGVQNVGRAGQADSASRGTVI